MLIVSDVPPPEPSPPGLASLNTRYATVKKAVSETAAPRTYAAEVPFQLTLVAKKTALLICGPAIITIANGKTDARLTWASLCLRRPRGVVAVRRAHHDCACDQVLQSAAPLAQQDWKESEEQRQ